jgi:hypothetical protein
MSSTERSDAIGGWEDGEVVGCGDAVRSRVRGNNNCGRKVRLSVPAEGAAATAVEGAVRGEVKGPGARGRQRRM